MSIEQGVVAQLNGTSEITSLVSNRIYANTLPNGTEKPAIVYQLTSSAPFDSHLTGDEGLFVDDLQLTLYADSTSVREGLTTAVKVALQRFRGAVGGITILDSRIENIFDLAYELDTKKVSRIADLRIYYR